MSNRDLPMMPWYPDQFAASCRAMRYAWRVAYRELLDSQWQLGVLPDDPELLAQAIGCPLDQFLEIWPHIRGKFQQVEGGLQNFRLEQHRLTALKRKDRMRRGASATNAKRWGSDPPSDSPGASGSESPPVSHPSPSPSPYKNQERAPQGAEAPRAPNGEGQRPNGAHARPTAQLRSAEWAKLRERAQAAGFREPYAADTPDTYETSLKLHERDHPRP